MSAQISGSYIFIGGVAGERGGVQNNHTIDSNYFTAPTMNFSSFNLAMSAAAGFVLRYIIPEGDHELESKLDAIGYGFLTPVFFVVNPEWYPVFDMDPPMAVETRKRLLDRAATERMPVVGYHFDMPATGRIERAGSGYRVVPANA